MTPKRYSCPLCRSILSRERFLRVVGVWEERKKELDKLKKERQQLKKEYKLKLEEAVSQGVAKEKRRADRLLVMKKKDEDKIDSLNIKIKKLREQLKRGTTPQIEGLNLEKELVKELKNSFPLDEIVHYGRTGDVLQNIKYKNKIIGTILYECKKTDRFLKSHLTQIKKATAKRKASHGVLVTTAKKKGKEGFWVEKNVLVVHPFAAIYIAEVLRDSMIELTSTRISKVERGRRERILMRYIKGDHFRNSVADCIYRSKYLYDLLKKEARSHFIIWKERGEHYFEIHKNVSLLQLNMRRIIRGDKPIMELAKEGQLPLLEFKPRKRK
jgi:hypothetical protein